jgi:hypothetical protein
VLTAAGQPVTTVLLWLGTVLVSVALVEVFVRTPLSLPLTGRRRPRGDAPPGPLTASAQRAPGRGGEPGQQKPEPARTSRIETGSDS